MGEGMAEPNPMILYDGVCGLCNRLNRFTLQRDKMGIFRFAALQSDLARVLLQRQGADPVDLDTFYVALDTNTPQERLLARSQAALYVLRTLGGPWRLLTVFGLLPTFLLDRLNAGSLPVIGPNHIGRFLGMFFPHQIDGAAAETAAGHAGAQDFRTAQGDFDPSRKKQHIRQEIVVLLCGSWQGGAESDHFV